MEPDLFEVNAIAAGIPGVIMVLVFEIFTNKHLEKLDNDTVYRMTAYSVMLALGLFGFIFVLANCLVLGS
jgi:hypothetical protein